MALKTHAHTHTDTSRSLTSNRLMHFGESISLERVLIRLRICSVRSVFISGSVSIMRPDTHGMPGTQCKAAIVCVAL